jgi:hypothetical protein
MTMIKELGRIAPFPSVRLPCDTIRCDICGSPVHYPGIHHCRRGEESSNSVTIKAPMFSGPHLSRMHQYIIKLACWARRSFVNRDRWGLPPRSSESDKRPLSTFPSSVLHSPLIGPARSHIESQSDRYHKSHRTISEYGGPITSGYQPVGFYQWPILLSIAILSFHFHHGGKQGILARVFLMQLSFHRIPIHKCITIA